jgi:hypothetical protein
MDGERGNSGGRKRYSMPVEDSTAAHGGSDSHVQVVHSWVTGYLAQPHDELGRAGPVCPFAGPSLDRDLLWMAVVEGASPSVIDVVAELREFAERFLALQPASGPDSLLKAAFIAFPEVVDYAVIDEIQAALKSDFVDAGLMIGQFYEGCAEPGLWNPRFRPLQSPMPLIAVRHMVSNDFPFLNATPAWIEAYLRRFAPTVPSPVRAALAGGFGNVSARRDGVGNSSTGSADTIGSAPAS